MTLQERYEWIYANTAELVQWRTIPWGTAGGLEAGEPLSFYAFCCEWAGYIEEGIDYVCSLPVCVDGTNNGLQHFGALCSGRDRWRGGEPAAARTAQDVYKMVAEDVLEMLESRAATEPMAALWLRTQSHRPHALQAADDDLRLRQQGLRVQQAVGRGTEERVN
jgi:DNA-directed RNA polymerase